MTSAERAAEIEDVIHQVTRWVGGRDDIVELGIGRPDWAGVDPVDPGTYRVVTDGARILHDPTAILATQLRACRN